MCWKSASTVLWWDPVSNGWVYPIPERICRYIARPAVAEERLSRGDRGDVIYRFKKPWSDGTSAIKLTPLELMERLAALVPRPRVHLTRFHGVLAPHYKHRSEIVPKAKEQPLQVPADKNKKPFKQRIPWARLLARVFSIDVETCPHCQGRVKIIAAIEDPAVIVKILEHLGLPSRAPQIHSARGPPQTNESADFDMSQLPSIETYFDPIFQD